MKRISYNDLKIHRAVLEIRYPKGYRYWDVCGKCILEINTKSNKIIDFLQLSGGEECLLKFRNDPNLSASFGFRHMTVAGNNLKNIEILKENGPLIFDVIQKNLDIQKVDRIGLRFWLVYRTETSEEAKEIVNSLELFEVAAQRFKGFGTEIQNVTPSIVVTSGKTKTTITIGTAKREEEFSEIDNNEKLYAPKHCVLIDIDSYQENIKLEDIDVEKFVYDCKQKIKDNIGTLLNKKA